MASATRAGMLCARQLQAPPKRLSSSSFSPAASIRSSSSILRRTQFAQRQPSTARIAAFATSARKKILPPGPQVIEGGVNDPAPVPEAHPTHGSYHWILERAVSVGLIPLTLAPFAGAAMYPTLDAILVGGLLIHSHMGFQAMVTDYIPTRQYPGWRKLFDYGVYLATLLVGIGLYEFETNDVGLTEGIKRIWHAGVNDATIGKADVSNALGYDGKLKNLK